MKRVRLETGFSCGFARVFGRFAAKPLDPRDCHVAVIRG